MKGQLLQQIDISCYQRRACKNNQGLSKFSTDLKAAGGLKIDSTELAVDDTNSQDEYTITWFKNGVRIISGITSPTIQVIKRTDGTDLISSTAMTQIGSTGSYKYDEATNRITAGEAVIAVVAGTIDGKSRTFAAVLNRDT